MTATAPTAMAPETKSFNGDFLLFRQNGGRPPRFRHKTLAAADTEARRLLEHAPTATFLILQEVGRVKLKQVEVSAVEIEEIAA